MVFTTTLATSCFSHPSNVPVSFSLEATDYGDILLGFREAHTHYCNGGGEPCGAPAFLIPLRSLTRPVGQPSYAFHLG
jgi:hypothetical protein